MTANPTDLTVTLVRVYDAPAHLLFRAWSQPEHLAAWFGPGEWPVTLCEIDFRVGGKLRMAMTGPSGVQNTPFGGQYLEIIPDRKIVFSNGFESEPEKMIMTITFEEFEGRTTLTHHTRFPSRAMYDGHVGGGFEAGTAISLDQLAGVVERLQTGD